MVAVMQSWMLAVIKQEMLAAGAIVVRSLLIFVVAQAAVGLAAVPFCGVYLELAEGWQYQLLVWMLVVQQGILL